MEIKDINKKVTDKIYCVCICNVCDSVQGYYTDIEEAKAKAQHEYELLNKNNCIDVQEMVWDESEEEYVYDYSTDFTIESFGIENLY